MKTLAEKLDSGIAPAARRSLPADWPYTIDELRANGVQAILQYLYQIRKAAGVTPAEVDTALAALASELAASRPLMLGTLFSPAELPAVIPDIAGRAAGNPVEGWMGACWMAEAAWQALSAPLKDPEYAAGDRELLLPLAARCRFLALSEPMRYRAERGSPWLAFEEGTEDIPGPGRVFGTDSWNRLIGRCREARRVWLDCLDAYQSHLFLSQAKPGELEQELRTVMFRNPGGGFRYPRGREPLGLSVRTLDEAASLTAEDNTFIDEVTDRHLLPRFDLASVVALAPYDDDRRRRWARLLLGVIVGLAGLAAVTCAALLFVRQATWIAVGCYLLIGAGVLAFGTRWAAPWLLRLPAASAVGVIALVTFLPAGWLRTPSGGWAAVAVLATSACGYLAVELRNHGVAGMALLRALGVAAIGAVHALLVSLLGLVAVAPAFVPKGRVLSALWHRPGYGHAGMVLLLSTAWCLAVGVFSQILWDDRPITSPLAHLSWRSAR